MTTRKQFLKDISSAAVLSTPFYLNLKPADAAPHRSMLGANATSTVEDSKWVNPYVTDGLVAMFDGQWNAWGGKHANSRIVTNLATGEQISLDDATNSQNASIEEKCLHVISPCSLLVPSLRLSFDASIPKTFEIVFARTDAATKNNNWNSCGWNDCMFVLGSMTTNGLGAVSSRKTKFSCLTRYGNLVTQLNRKESWSTTTLGIDEARQTYRNSQEVSVTIHNYTWTPSAISFYLFNFAATEGTGARIYTMRGYNRALTAEEVAYNYSVDKARFNLL